MFLFTIILYFFHSNAFAYNAINTEEYNLKSYQNENPYRKQAEKFKNRERLFDQIEVKKSEIEILNNLIAEKDDIIDKKNETIEVKNNNLKSDKETQKKEKKSSSFFELIKTFENYSPPPVAQILGNFIGLRLGIGFPYTLNPSVKETNIQGSESYLFDIQSKYQVIPNIAISVGTDRKYFQYELEFLYMSMLNSSNTIFNQSAGQGASFIVSRKDLTLDVINLSLNGFIKIDQIVDYATFFIGAGIGIGYVFPRSKEFLTSNMILPTFQATDIEIHAKEILTLKKRLNEIYVYHTGKDIETIERNMERDNFMSANEALSFGIIDHVITNRSDIKLNFNKEDSN